MSKKKLIFFVIKVPILIFILIYAYEFITESYCWNKGDSLSNEEKSLHVSPTEEESKRGIIYQSNYYRTISNCRKQFPRILFR